MARPTIAMRLRKDDWRFHRDGLRRNGIDVGSSSGRDDLRLVLDSGGFFGHHTLLFGLFADSGLDRYRSRRYNSGINRACQ